MQCFCEKIHLINFEDHILIILYKYYRFSIGACISLMWTVFPPYSELKGIELRRLTAVVAGSQSSLSTLDRTLYIYIYTKRI